jgi:aspartyl-tRNA(Asn)/glutamyl-tRNA(Gln) amidotransferase subunit C
MEEKPDIEYLTKLARMELSAAEKTSLEKDLGAIIDYMTVLSKIDTDTITPMEHVLGLSNVTRADEPVPSYDRERLLACAPKAEEGFYDVPLAVEQE